MCLNAAFTLLLLGILTSVLVTGQECGLRNTAAAGRSCERACGDGGTCRKENRECVCDGLCGLSCLKKACPLLQSPVQGYVTVTPSQHYIDAVAQYRCNRDHTLVGNSNRTCQSDKTWSGSEPVCRELSDSAPVLAETHHCSLLAFPTNGVVAYYEERRIEGAIATYRCDDGYTLIGNKNRTCLRERSWSGSEPDCVVLYCSDMNIPDGNVHHGEVNRISREGDDITFSCKEGFQLRYPQRTCTGGRWTQALPYCEEGSCNKMDLQNSEWNIDVSIEDGNNADIIHLPGTVAIVTCNEFGFLETPTSGGRKTCSFGEWQGFELLCERVSCSTEEFLNGQLVHYDHNNQRTTNPQHGGRRQAVCESGTHFIDGVVVHTSRCWNGQWDHEVPSCVSDPCPPLVNHPDNLAVTYSEESDGTHYPHSTLATFHCVEGFVLENVNEEQRTCIRGEWRGPNTFPSCTIEDNRCLRPYIFPNIIAHVGVGEDTTAIGNRQSFMGGETITFRCEDVRYQILDGPIHRQCIDGEWTERAPRCETSQLQVGVDNTKLKTVSPDGAFIVYPIEGSIFINCELRTGGFIGNSATITTNSTTQPSQRAYRTGRIKRLRLRNPTSGNDGTYTCEDGTQRHSIRIKFQDIRCPAPGNVLNGRWAYVRATANTLNPHAYILNELVTVQCNPGYHVSSNQESRCDYPGQWSPPLSSCIAD